MDPDIKKEFVKDALKILLNENLSKNESRKEALKLSQKMDRFCQSKPANEESVCSNKTRSSVVEFPEHSVAAQESQRKKIKLKRKKDADKMENVGLEEKKKEKRVRFCDQNEVNSTDKLNFVSDDRLMAVQGTNRSHTPSVSEGNSKSSEEESVVPQPIQEDTLHCFTSIEMVDGTNILPAVREYRRVIDLLQHKHGLLTKNQHRGVRFLKHSHDSVRSYVWKIRKLLMKKYSCNVDDNTEEESVQKAVPQTEILPSSTDQSQEDEFCETLQESRDGGQTTAKYQQNLPLVKKHDSNAYTEEVLNMLTDQPDSVPMPTCWLSLSLLKRLQGQDKKLLTFNIKTLLSDCVEELNNSHQKSTSKLILENHRQLRSDKTLLQEALRILEELK